MAGSRPPRRVVTPTVIQMEAVECGAAALSIVLAYYGRLVPPEELRLACGVSRDGSKASNILRAARTYGLEAQGWRKEIGALRQMQGPMIVFWQFNHFLVVEGFGKGVVYLSDPASGRRTVSDAEFDRGFTGIVLELRPSATFTRGGESRDIVAVLKRRLAGSKGALLYAVLVGLVLVIPGLATPTFTRLFIDRVVITRDPELPGPLLLAMLGTAIFTALATLLQRHYLMRLETRLSVASSSQFLWHVLRAPMAFFTQRSSGDIGARIASNDTVAMLLSGQLASTALSVVTATFFLVVLFSYDAILATCAAIVAVLNLVTLRLVSARRVAGNQKLQADQGQLVGATMYGLQSIETLKAGGNESDFFTRWAGFQAKVVTGTGDLAVPSLLVTAIPSLLMALNSVAILWIGGLRVMDGVLTIGTLMAFQTLAASFTKPVSELVGLGATIQMVEADLDRLDDVLNYPLDAEPEAEAPSGGAAPQVKLSGAIELRNVTFGYSRLEPPLIVDFSLTVRPGERVALVGGSGSGKSTIARLVTGLQRPWSGEILFDGLPRAAHPRRLLTDSIGLVDQEIFLFEGSLRDNLTMWDATLPDARIVQAAKDACIHEDIAARPGAYEGRVDEGGRNFSGGQRQRLEIARALVGDPTIVVLDEATSALDSTTEKQVDDHLRRRGCTCLIVAHRLSTIRDCDEIIVLEKGVVVQRGTHEQMKGVDGPYARLIAE